MHRTWVKMCVLAICICLISGCSAKENEAKILEEAELSREKASEEQDKETSEEESDEGAKDTIYVYVCGQVVSPGVYELQKDSRVYEAVEAAGGMKDAAADTYLNQAESLEDGQKVYVPSREEVKNDIGIPENVQKDDGKVDLNTASKEELMTLNGIGEARADAILKYREEKGGFGQAEDLKEVEGIKEGIYSKIKDQIKV